MSMDKAIASGKEHRKPYYKKCQQIDKQCRCGGSCDWCRNNRKYANNKRYQSIEYKYKLWNGEKKS